MPEYQIVKNKGVYRTLNCSEHKARSSIQQVSWTMNGASWHLYKVLANGDTEYIGTWLSGKFKGKLK